MRKVRPKTANNKNNHLNKQLKVPIETVKSIIQNADNRKQLLILDKTKLLPILNAYQPRVLKHILIAQKQKILLNHQGNKNHQNCQIHNMMLKSLIGYFVQWKKNIKIKLKQFQALISNIDFNKLSQRNQINLFKKELIFRLEEASTLNKIIEDKLYKMVQKQGINYINKTIQQHRQNPMHKAQPLAKQANQIRTKQQHQKIAAIIHQFHSYSKVIQSILDIFKFINQIGKQKPNQNALNTQNNNNIQQGSLQSIQKILQEGDPNKIKHLEQNLPFVQNKLLAILWPQLQIKIRQAFMLCLQNQNQIQTENDSLYKTKQFYLTKKAANSSTSNAFFGQRLNTKQRSLSTSKNSLKKTQNMWQRLKNNIGSLQSSPINLNLVEFKIKKLFPFLVSNIIQSIRQKIFYKRVQFEYDQYLSNQTRSILDKIQSVQFSQNRARQNQIVENLYNWFLNTIKQIEQKQSYYNGQISAFQTALSFSSDKQINKKDQSINKKIVLSIRKKLQILKQVVQINTIRFIFLYKRLIQKEQSILQYIKQEGSKYSKIKQLTLRIIKTYHQGIWQLKIGVKQLETQTLQEGVIQNSIFLSILSQFSHLYSSLSTSILQKNVDMKLIISHNYNVDCHDSQSVLEYFQEIKELTQSYQKNKYQIVKEINQKLLKKSQKELFAEIKKYLLQLKGNSQENKLEGVILSVVQRMQKLMERFCVQINSQNTNQIFQEKNLINNMIKLPSIKVSNNQPSKQPAKLQYQPSKQLQNLTRFIQLLRYSQKTVLNQVQLLKQPQKYLKNLKQKSMDLLIHPKLINQISNLNNKLKQYQRILTQEQLIEYVVKKPDMKMGFMEEVLMKNNQNGKNEGNQKQQAMGNLMKMIMGSGAKDINIGSNNESKIKQSSKIQLKQNKPNQIVNTDDQPLLFPGIPILISTTQQLKGQSQSHQSKLFGNLLIPQTSKRIKSERQKTQTCSISHISQLIKQKQLLFGFSTIEQIRKMTYKINQKVGYTIDNMEQLGQIQEFNKFIDQKMQFLENIKNGHIIIKVIEEIIRLAFREWDKIMKKNNFLKCIRLEYVVKALVICYDQNMKNDKRFCQDILSYFKELLQHAQKVQSIIQSQKQISQTSNKQLLQQINKLLQTKQYTSLDTKLRTFLKTNMIIIDQFSFNTNKQNSKQIRLNKMIYQKAQQKVIKQWNQISSKIIVVKKSIKSKHGTQNKQNKNKGKNRIKKQQNPNLFVELKIRQDQIKQLFFGTIPDIISSSMMGNIKYDNSNNQSNNILEQQLKKAISQQNLTKTKHIQQNIQYFQYYIQSIQSTVSKILNHIKKHQSKLISPNFVNNPQTLLSSILSQQNIMTLIKTLFAQLNEQVYLYVREGIKIVSKYYLHAGLEQEYFNFNGSNNSSSSNNQFQGLVKLVEQKLVIVASQWLKGYIYQRVKLKGSTNNVNIQTNRQINKIKGSNRFAYSSIDNYLFEQQKTLNTQNQLQQKDNKNYIFSNLLQIIQLNNQHINKSNQLNYHQSNNSISQFKQQVSQLILNLSIILSIINQIPIQNNTLAHIQNNALAQQNKMNQKEGNKNTNNLLNNKKKYVLFAIKTNSSSQQSLYYNILPCVNNNKQNHQQINNTSQNTNNNDRQLLVLCLKSIKFQQNTQSVILVNWFNNNTVLQKAINQSNQYSWLTINNLSEGYYAQTYQLNSNIIQITLNLQNLFKTQIIQNLVIKSGLSLMIRNIRNKQPQFNQFNKLNLISKGLNNNNTNNNKQNLLNSTINHNNDFIIIIKQIIRMVFQKQKQKYAKLSSINKDNNKNKQHQQQQQKSYIYQNLYKIKQFINVIKNYHNQLFITLNNYFSNYSILSSQGQKHKNSTQTIKVKQKEQISKVLQQIIHIYESLINFMSQQDHLKDKLNNQSQNIKLDSPPKSLRSTQKIQKNPNSPRKNSSKNSLTTNKQRDSKTQQIKLSDKNSSKVSGFDKRQAHHHNHKVQILQRQTKRQSHNHNYNRIQILQKQIKKLLLKQKQLWKALKALQQLQAGQINAQTKPNNFLKKNTNKNIQPTNNSTTITSRYILIQKIRIIKILRSTNNNHNNHAQYKNDTTNNKSKNLFTNQMILLQPCYQNQQTIEQVIKLLSLSGNKQSLTLTKKEQFKGEQSFLELSLLQNTRLNNQKSAVVKQSQHNSFKKLSNFEIFVLQNYFWKQCSQYAAYYKNNQLQQYLYQSSQFIRKWRQCFNVSVKQQKNPSQEVNQKYKTKDQTKDIEQIDFAYSNKFIVITFNPTSQSKINSNDQINQTNLPIIRQNILKSLGLQFSIIRQTILKSKDSIKQSIHSSHTSQIIQKIYKRYFSSMLELDKLSNQNTALIKSIQLLKAKQINAKNITNSILQLAKQRQASQQSYIRIDTQQFYSIESQNMPQLPLNSKVRLFNSSQQDNNFIVLNNLQSLQSKIQSKQGNNSTGKKSEPRNQQSARRHIQNQSSIKKDSNNNSNSKSQFKDQQFQRVFFQDGLKQRRVSKQNSPDQDQLLKLSKLESIHSLDQNSFSNVQLKMQSKHQKELEQSNDDLRFLNNMDDDKLLVSKVFQKSNQQQGRRNSIKKTISYQIQGNQIQSYNIYNKTLHSFLLILFSSSTGQIAKIIKQQNVQILNQLQQIRKTIKNIFQKYSNSLYLILQEKQSKQPNASNLKKLEKSNPNHVNRKFKLFEQITQKQVSQFTEFIVQFVKQNKVVDNQKQHQIQSRHALIINQVVDYWTKIMIKYPRAQFYLQFNNTRPQYQQSQHINLQLKIVYDNNQVNNAGNSSLVEQRSIKKTSRQSTKSVPQKVLISKTISIQYLKPFTLHRISIFNSFQQQIQTLLTSLIISYSFSQQNCFNKIQAIIKNLKTQQTRLKKQQKSLQDKIDKQQLKKIQQTKRLQSEQLKRKQIQEEQRKRRIQQENKKQQELLQKERIRNIHRSKLFKSKNQYKQSNQNNLDYQNQITLSDMWGVDQVDFYQEFNQQQKDKFYRLNQKIQQKQYESKLRKTMNSRISTFNKSKDNFNKTVAGVGFFNTNVNKQLGGNSQQMIEQNVSQSSQLSVSVTFSQTQDLNRRNQIVARHEIVYPQSRQDFKTTNNLRQTKFLNIQDILISKQGQKVRKSAIQKKR